MQPTINPLACCICWARLLGRAVFPPWNEGPNFGSYSALPPSLVSVLFVLLNKIVYKIFCLIFVLLNTHSNFIYIYRHMKYENLIILIDITDANNVLLSLFPFLFIYLNKLGYKNLRYMTQFLSEYSQDLK